jgi:hypothetical protein
MWWRAITLVILHPDDVSAMISLIKGGLASSGLDGKRYDSSSFHAH